MLLRGETPSMALSTVKFLYNVFAPLIMLVPYAAICLSDFNFESGAVFAVNDKCSEIGIVSTNNTDPFDNPFDNTFNYSFGLSDLTVAAAVTFTVSATNFVTPTPSGIASYGTLDISALSDNALRICGNGNQKCTTAAIRMYTTGTTGDGLWSVTEGYGLPITTTGGTTVGLNAAGAATAATFAIAPNKRTLSLADLSASSPMQIPLSVNFSDAAAASDYSTTVVIEYVTQ